MFLFLILSLCAGHVAAKSLAHHKPSDITVIVSDASGDRLTEKIGKVLWRKTTENDGDVLELDPKITYQQFDGIGGSFMRAGAKLLDEMPENVQDNILRDLFDQNEGAAFSLGKIPIAATDFGIPTWYSYADEEQPEDLPDFSLEYDLVNTVGGSGGAYIPYVKRAMAVANRTLRLQATMDYAPHWMLNSSTPLPSPDLNSTLLGALANYYYKFFHDLSENGVPLEAISLFNELTDSYMNASYENTRDLLVDHVYPLFKEMGEKNNKTVPKLTFTAKFGRRVTMDASPAFYEMSGTQEATDVIFFHGYDCNYGPAEGLGWQCKDLNTSCPFLKESAQEMKRFYDTYGEDRQLWMTEVCYASEFGDYNTSNGCPDLPRFDFDDAMQWGDMLFADFNVVGVSGWLYWNMILDMSGGPWLRSPQHNDPMSNPQQPIIIVDPSSGEYYRTGVYYAMSHFSRYIAAGNAHRISIVPLNNSIYPTIQYTAFVNHMDPEREIFNEVAVVIVMNNDPSPHTISLRLKHYVSTPIVLPPVSFVTLKFVLH